MNQFLTTGFIDSKLAFKAKKEKINLTEITKLQQELKDLKDQLNNSEVQELENQVEQPIVARN